MNEDLLAGIGVGFMAGVSMGLLGSQYVAGIFGSIVAVFLSLIPWVTLLGVLCGIAYCIVKLATIKSKR